MVKLNVRIQGTDRASDLEESIRSLKDKIESEVLAAGLDPEDVCINLSLSQYVGGLGGVNATESEIRANQIAHNVWSRGEWIDHSE